MTFQVPASAASIDQNRFHFTLPGDRKKYSLPKVQYLPRGIKDRLNASILGVKGDAATADQAQVIWDAQLAILKDYIPEVLAKLTDEQIPPLIAAWYAESTSTVGKSSASSKS